MTTTTRRTTVASAQNTSTDYTTLRLDYLRLNTLVVEGRNNAVGHRNWRPPGISSVAVERRSR